MDNPAHRNRNWNILNWNVRGLSSADKCNAIRAKINESSCTIFCIQETKFQHFEPSAIRKFAPKRFNKFTFFPSEGASRGLFIAWNGSVLVGNVIYSSKFAITIHFTAQHNAETWKLMNVYGPCQGRDRHDFVDWLNSIQITDDENWLFMGDFNFYRSFENRNRDGGNMQDIMVFNSIISNLGL
jgi:exonuclease III